MRQTLVLAVCFVTIAVAGEAHDIPNARVDRSIQLTVAPGKLEVSYEVSLSELTLVRDLRDLIGSLPDSSSRELFDRYGKETGPLNAKGMLVSIDGRALDLTSVGFDVFVEEHPRYQFHFQAAIPPSGRIAFRDTNFSGSEGTSRLAIRAREGLMIQGDDLPSEVEQIAVRPVWQLSDREELRTKELEVDYRLRSPGSPPPTITRVPAPTKSSSKTKASHRLADLLDSAPRSSFWALMLIATGLGALHALQPGHGKTLVASATLGERGRWLPSALLALVATFTHTGSVLLIAAGLWLTRSSRYGTIHHAVAQFAGFAIAAIGLWRLGRHLGGHGEHDVNVSHEGTLRISGLVGLGIAAGMVPCWDAVALVVLSEAVGRLGLGVLLLLAFSAGMAIVLIAIGWIATRLRRAVSRPESQAGWDRLFGIVSGVILSLIGITLLAST